MKFKDKHAKTFRYSLLWGNNQFPIKKQQRSEKQRLCGDLGYLGDLGIYYLIMLKTVICIN